MHLTPEDIKWNVPTIQIMLCLRESIRQLHPDIITLQDKEDIENGLY